MNGGGKFFLALMALGVVSGLIDAFAKHKQAHIAAKAAAGMPRKMRTALLVVVAAAALAGAIIGAVITLVMSQ